MKALTGAAMLACLALAAPAAAQNADAPIDITAAPPPSAETVGPAQLRDFNLNGTVTRPSEQPATTTPQAPATAAPQSAAPPVNPGSASAVPAAPRASAPVGDRINPVPAGDSVQADAASPFATEPSAPTMPTDVAINSGGYDFDDPADFAAAPDLGGGAGLPVWPWILALLALAGGIAFYLRSRRNQRARYGDFGRLAFVGAGADAGGDVVAPPAAPRPKPATPAPQPPRAQPAPPRPRHDPTPAPAPTPAPKNDGLIVSTRLKPSLQIEFTPDRAVVTERDVMIQFDVVIVNSGSAPARDVLVEGRIVGAHAGQDREIGEFFQNPVARGDRMAIIHPLGRIPLKTALRLPLDELKTFEVDGRKLFVPMVAFNLLYRAGTEEGQSSASFLVGRGSDEDEKLAPFRLDLGPRIFRGLSSRPHSMGLQR